MGIVYPSDFVGIILFESIHPMPTDNEGKHQMLSKIRKSEFPITFEQHKEVKEVKHQMIIDMVSHDPKERPNIKEVLSKMKQICEKEEIKGK